MKILFANDETVVLLSRLDHIETRRPSTIAEQFVLQSYERGNIQEMLDRMLASRTAPSFVCLTLV